MPYNARGPFVVSDGTFVYLGGGYDGTDVHSDLLRYDPVTNTYTPLADSPDEHFLSQAVIYNNKVEYVIPTSGGFSWVDSMAIPKGAPHPGNALKFMNYMLEPKVGAALTNGAPF